MLSIKTFFFIPALSIKISELIITATATCTKMIPEKFEKFLFVRVKMTLRNSFVSIVFHYTKSCPSRSITKSEN